MKRVFAFFVLGVAAVIGLGSLTGCPKDGTTTTETVTTTDSGGPTETGKDGKEGTTATPTGKGESETFFNGNDLDGWQGLPEYWRAANGTIVGEIRTKSANKIDTYLCSKRVYRDFDMKLQVQLTGNNANSGVNVRSKLTDPEKFAVTGPQCDIFGNQWGRLQGAKAEKGADKGGKKKVKVVINKEEFNDYEIKCVGKHLIVRVNGEITLDDDVADMAAEGIIAFQLSSKQEMRVVFKNIQFTDLTKR